MKALLAAWFASNLEDVPERTPLAEGAAFDAMPVVNWAVRLPGTAAPTATRSEPGGPTADAARLYVGASGVSALFVLDRRNGELLDSLATQAPVQAPPWVGPEGLLVCDLAGYSSLYRLEGKRWVKRWSHFSGAPILSRPTVADGVVYLSNVDEQVFALDLASGELRWRHEHKLDLTRGASMELYGAPSPTLAGDLLFAGFSDGLLVALGAADGSPRWEARVGEGTYPDLIAPASVAGASVLVGGFTEPFMALSPENRSTAWRHGFGIAAPAAVDGEVIYAPGTDGRLRRIAARTGEVEWEWDSAARLPAIFAPVGPDGQPTEARGASGVLGRPLLTPVGLFVASSEGSLHLLDPASGKLRWTFDPGMSVEGIAAPPVIAGKDLYLVTNGGMVYDLRATPPDAVMPGEDWVGPR